MSEVELLGKILEVLQKIVFSFQILLGVLGFIAGTMIFRRR